MKRICAALFFFAAIISPPAAIAEVPADAATRAHAAAADFATLAQAAQAKGTVPHWRDPETRAVMERMIDPALFGAPPYSAKDAQQIEAVVTSARNAYLTYVVYLQKSMKGTTTAQMQASAMAVQDEMARFSAFFLRAQAVSTPALADVFTHLKPEQLTEVRLQGLRRMRLGITQMMQGAGMMARGGMKPENQAVLVDAVADSAAPIAAGLSMTARAQVAEQLHEQFVGLPAPLAARIDEAGKAMASTKCSGLCTLE